MRLDRNQIQRVLEDSATLRSIAANLLANIDGDQVKRELILALKERFTPPYCEKISMIKFVRQFAANNLIESLMGLMDAKEFVELYFDFPGNI